MAKLLTLSAMCLFFIGASNAVEFKDCGEFCVRILCLEHFFWYSFHSICLLFTKYEGKKPYLSSNYDFDFILIHFKYNKSGWLWLFIRYNHSLFVEKKSIYFCRQHFSEIQTKMNQPKLMCWEHVKLMRLYWSNVDVAGFVYAYTKSFIVYENSTVDDKAVETQNV